MKEKVSIYKIVLYLLCIFLVLLFLYKCPFEFLFGVTCPGCGMTRALISFVKLDFVSAFHYHPLFGLVLIAATIWILKYLGIKLMSDKTFRIIEYVLCTLFIIVYLVRLFCGSDVVYIDYKEGLIYKIIQYLFH